MKLSVIGIGYVGLVAAACFAENNHHVICFDKDESKIKKIKRGDLYIYEPGLEELIHRNIQNKRLIFSTDLHEVVNDSSVIFIAVGTPPAEDGSADITELINVVNKIAGLMNTYHIIVVKSTVPVGTHKIISDIIKTKSTVNFDYVSNPEFLKQGCAVNDFTNPERIIIGTVNPAVKETMRKLFNPFTAEDESLIFMDPSSAEMIKYVANAMLATRISFMNEIALLCEKFGVDVELVRKGIGSDSRIGHAFLSPGIGYGGSCFPKDLKALINMGDKNNCPMYLIKSVQQVNAGQKDHFAGNIINYFNSGCSGTTLAVWGLAFKANTNDIRESPAIYCINKFLKKGMKIRAYDPQAIPAAKTQFDSQINFCASSYETLDDADALVIFTEWQEFKTPDFSVIKKRLKKPLIFDGRNLFDPISVKNNGIEYYSIGRL